jgi:GST-like protein
MIKFYFNLAPNPMKVALLLEELETPYEPIPVDTRRGEQFAPAYLAVNPNAKLPAIVDGDAVVFDSNAILLYLAEKTGQFLPTEPRARAEVLQWLFWQVGGLGPMLGQHGHFKLYAKEKIPYAIQRYEDETKRLYGVMDRRLESREHLAGAYSIADMACWPWIVTYKAQGIDLGEFPNVRRWYDALKQRPALQRGFALGKDLRQVVKDGPDDESRKHLFGKR